MGRHHGGRGFGRFAAGFTGGWGRGGPDFRTGRKLGAPDLQLLVLALLEKQPSHGYELIKMLEERSNGFYSPSPGVIYPALTYLEEIGHAVSETEGNKKLYRLTDAGREHLERNRAAVQSMLAELERIGAKMERVRQVFSGEGLAAEEESWGRRRGELAEARHALRHALHRKQGCTAEEERRIAEILRRAAEEILGK
ncbi:MAG TPA: PadR family transcriptional regulator [Steroidobacteraceae bacterium]|nr:PadR family transcriptional regulator [Steroidobacteraceae bacterium]